MTSSLWLRWSARDLRRRWIQVAAISLIIATGTGLYAALGSTKTWRLQSNDASYAALRVHDLHVELAEGSTVPRGQLMPLVDGLAGSVLDAAQERLVTATQVDASAAAGTTVLVPGRLIGMSTSAKVDQLSVTSGRGLETDDRGAAVAVIENNFARFYDLPPTGEVTIAGGRSVRFVGSAMGPEYFMVTTEGAGFLAEANFAVLFVPLETAQDLAGRPGQVNDLVVRLHPGADVAAAKAMIEEAIAGRAGLGATVTPVTEETSYRILYDDPESDEVFWNVFAGLILAGAAFGAFNLSTRMVEAQRREIGIGMAIGMRPAAIAARPLLVGAEIAALGTLFGLGMGWVAGQGLRSVYETFLPLPVWKTDIQVSAFVRAAALGFAVPLLATVWPVWRAVRVDPVEAIRTGHRGAKGGLAPLVQHLPVPGGAFGRMPFGNVFRTPRRTFLTALGIGAAITATVVTLGMIDSFLVTVDRGERELFGTNEQRLTVDLDRFYPAVDPAIASIAAAPSVGSWSPGVRVGGRLASGDRDPVDVVFEVVDFDGGLWRPTASAGRLGGEGLVIAEKAASDLGVGVGDAVKFTRPMVTAEGIVVTETSVEVAAIHPNPMRIYAYADDSASQTLLGVSGVANFLQVVPAPGASVGDVQRALFPMDAVASVQPVSTMGKVLRDAMDEFVSILRGMQVFVLLLAVLIAFNASSINVDERAREHATLFAFGLPVRRVVRMDVIEGALIGVLGTIAGLVGGVVVLGWMVTYLFTSTLPEVQMEVAMGAATYLTAFVMGVLAVALAPVLSVRRLIRMDIPSTLRIVE